jgi:hypothetical protein
MGALSAVFPSVWRTTPDVTYFESGHGGPPLLTHRQLDPESFNWVVSATTDNLGRIKDAGVKVEGTTTRFLFIDQARNGYARGVTIGANWLQASRNFDGVEVQQRSHFWLSHEKEPKRKPREGDFLKVRFEKASAAEAKGLVAKDGGDVPLHQLALDLALKAVDAYSTGSFLGKIWRVRAGVVASGKNSNVWLGSSPTMPARIGNAPEEALWKSGLVVFVPNAFELQFYRDRETGVYSVQLLFMASGHERNRVPVPRLAERGVFTRELKDRSWQAMDRDVFGPIEQDGIPLAELQPAGYRSPRGMPI